MRIVEDFVDVGQLGGDAGGEVGAEGVEADDAVDTTVAEAAPRRHEGVGTR